jgi:hypothetical protein
MATRGIVWIASYPKSGNTWVRAFLAACVMKEQRPLEMADIEAFGINDYSIHPYEDYLGRSVHGMSYDEVKRIRHNVHRYIVDRLNNLVVMKTHSPVSYRDGTPAMTWDATAGAIYIVRNPLDVVISFSNHLGKSIDETIHSLNSETSTSTHANQIPFYQGSWSHHVRGWTEQEDLERVVVRYEDLLADPEPQFRKIAELLGLKLDDAGLERVLSMTQFERLREAEQKSGFKEKPQHSERFFRTGKTKQWLNRLSAEQIQQITSANHAMMERFGYAETS